MNYQQVNKIDDHISVLWLSLYEFVILYDNAVVGMYHSAYNAARLSYDVQGSDKEKPLLKWLNGQELHVYYTGDYFGICEWINGEYVPCEELIKQSYEEEGDPRAKLNLGDKS